MDPTYRDPRARDGHVTDHDRKIAMRGERLADRPFPVTAWARPDRVDSTSPWGKVKDCPFVKPLKPSKKTHTRNWLEWFVQSSGGNRARLEIRL